MDLSQVAEKLSSELTCSVCLELLSQAVTLDCGHSFCRECVLQSWQQPHVSAWTCPLCRASFQPRALQPTQCLKELVSILRQLRPQPICGQHQAIQKLFCEDDWTPLCVSCLMSLEHDLHHVYPIEESAETCKGQLGEALGLVRAKVREVHILLEQEKRMWWKCQVEAHILMWVILPEYIKSHPEWTEEEQQHLLEEEKRRNLSRLKTTMDRTFGYAQSLKQMTQELEKTLEQPLVEMLLGGRSTLERSGELLLLCPQPAAALGWTVCETTAMRELLLAFQSHISLDPETAHSNLMVSADLKSVSLTSNRPDPLDNLQGELLCMLGAQAFTSGSHYWEVQVGSEMEWGVGICMASRNDQGNSEWDVRSLQYTKMGDQFELSISMSDVSEDLEPTGPLQTLGIFLHYEQGHLSFYNVTQGCLIYAFAPCPFQSPVRPFFSLGPPQEENHTSTLTICPLIPQN